MKQFFFVCVLLAGFGILYAQNNHASIKDISGKVEIKNAGDSSWKEAKRGDILQKNTLISTGFKSSAVLSIGNSTLTVKPLTRLSLEELVSAESSEEVKVYLSAGRVRADVNPPSGGRTDFSIRSPSATASVRGTSFEFDSVSLRVLGGNVNFAGRSGRTVEVSAGEDSQVGDGGGSAAAPRETAAAAAPQMPAGVTPWNNPVTGPSSDRGPGADGNIHIEITW